MERTPSLFSVSDDESYGFSAGPLTPESSPLFCPTDTGLIIDKQQARLLSEIATGERKPLKTTGKTWLPQRRSRDIENVCFIGAGYVGESNTRVHWTSQSRAD